MTSEQPSHIPTVILGAGYTGRRLFSLLAQAGRPVLATSRNPTTNLEFVPDHLRIPFTLEDPTKWSNLPDRADLIWCFPAQPLQLVKPFAEYLRPRVQRVVVLGSTSAYGVSQEPSSYPPPWLDETAPIDMSRPRVQGEECLRQECNAIVLRIAGIYGPGRNPLDWIRTGRVGPSRKYVNLIHVEDLAAICLAALERSVSGEVYNVSDGVPRTWSEICRHAEEHHGLRAVATDHDSSPGKRIANAKMLNALSVQLRRPDLFENLAGLGLDPIGPIR